MLLCVVAGCRAPVLGLEESPMFTGYAIKLSQDQVAIRWDTSIPLTTSYKWREEGGMWHVTLPNASLVTQHHGVINAELIMDGEVYELQVSGRDVYGTLYTGGILHFIREGDTVRFI